MDSDDTRNLEPYAGVGSVSRPRTRHAEHWDANAVCASAGEPHRDRRIHHGTAAFGAPPLFKAFWPEGAARRLSRATVADLDHHPEEPDIEPDCATLHRL